LGALGQATDVVLDKTGTLTTGRLCIFRSHVLGGLSVAQCVALAARLEAGSRHPIARAFGPPSCVPNDMHHVPGQGIEGEGLRIGSAPFCAELAGSAPPLPDLEAHTRVYLASEGRWLAAFDLADELRPDAEALLRDLERRGMTIHLASGDAHAFSRAMARQLGIEHASGCMRPQDKFDYVARLQAEGKVVVMIGDGLNDAPVLARADASFAMGSGADAAQLNADFVAVGSSLASVTATFTLARRSMQLVRQNLGWALAYNAVALPLAAYGLVGPWEAALAMAASSATVLLNALRPLDPKQWKASTSSFPSPSPSFS
jgi:Cu2+-exporting ATPase